MKLAQMFCTVNDLQADLETPGGNEARLYRAIREASQSIAREIGHFIPVTETLTLRGVDGAALNTAPLLELLDDITNGTDTLTTADVILRPTGRCWNNGPYLSIEIPSTVSQSWDATDEDSVSIPALTGLYNETQATGAALDGAIADDDETITVDNGAKLSPGMVLKIGDEQMLVTGTGAPVETVTALADSVSVGDESIAVDNLALLNIGEVVRIGFESMLVYDKSATRAAVRRGWNNTAKSTHAENDDVDVFRTFSVERGVNGTTAAAHADEAAIDRYVVPADIGYLCAQVATLMLNKAKSSYAGRTGNADTGTVFYNDAFPRYEWQRIADNYKLPRLHK